MNGQEGKSLTMIYHGEHDASTEVVGIDPYEFLKGKVRTVHAKIEEFVLLLREIHGDTQLEGAFLKSPAIPTTHELLRMLPKRLRGNANGVRRLVPKVTFGELL